MNGITFGLSYLEWHYTRALRNLCAALGNILAAVVTFFSLSTLATTLFSPWRRMGEERRTKGIDIEEMLSVLVINTLMRVVGFVIRFITLSLGLVVLSIVACGAFVLLVLWIVWPLLIFVLITNGLYFIIR